MKLSNKILIGFFGFIFLYLTAVFAEIRLRGTPNIIDDTNSIAETVDVPSIAYLVLQDLDRDINVIGSDQPRLEVRTLIGNALNKLQYSISGDTLILSDLMWDHKDAIKISLFVPKSRLKGVTIDSAGAIVKGLDQHSLRISQKAGRIRMSDNKIVSIHVRALNGSYLDISSTTLDTLSAEIEASHTYVWSSLKRLEGSMTNNAFLRVQNVDDIQLKKDSTSTINWYQ